MLIVVASLALYKISPFQLKRLAQKDEMVLLEEDEKIDRELAS